VHGGLGGEFAFDDAKLAYYQALTLADDHDPATLGHAAQAAIRFYQALPARARSYGCEALARVQLARAQLLTGTPAAAAETLAPVLQLDRNSASAASPGPCIPAASSLPPPPPADRELPASSTGNSLLTAPPAPGPHSAPRRRRRSS
jgi:hypothetical protein